MKKILPVVIVTLMAFLVGFGAWWGFLRGTPEKPPANDDTAGPAPDFKPGDFIATFDQDGDGVVTREEFKRLYGEPPLVFREGDDAPPLNADDAFNMWDKNGDGTIDRADIKRITDKAWENFFTETMERGLNPKDHKGEFLALSRLQFELYTQESAAAESGELPFAGEYFDAKYFGTWAEVDAPGGRRQGYVTEHAGKYWLLTPDRKLAVFRPDSVEVKFLPDAPPNRYAEEIRKVAWDDPAANVELARKAEEWGMSQEAEMMWGRVLIFNGGNADALEALGYEYRDGRHVKKDD